MSILRSGEIFSNSEVGGGGGLLREASRARCEAPEAGWVARASPLRPVAGLDFLREADLERVIGMAKIIILR